MVSGNGKRAILTVDVAGYNRLMGRRGLRNSKGIEYGPVGR